MRTGEREAFENQNWPFSHISDLRDLDINLGSGHTAYHCESLINLWPHT